MHHRGVYCEEGTALLGGPISRLNPALNALPPCRHVAVQVLGCGRDRKAGPRARAPLPGPVQVCTNGALLLAWIHSTGGSRWGIGSWPDLIEQVLRWVVLSLAGTSPGRFRNSGAKQPPLMHPPLTGAATLMGGGQRGPPSLPHAGLAASCAHFTARAFCPAADRSCRRQAGSGWVYQRRFIA